MSGISFPQIKLAHLLIRSKNLSRTITSWTNTSLDSARSYKYYWFAFCIIIGYSKAKQTQWLGWDKLSVYIKAIEIWLLCPFFFSFYIKPITKNIKMSNFPTGWFYIQSKCSHKMVLDVSLDSLKVIRVNTAIILKTKYRLKGSGKSRGVAKKNQRHWQSIMDVWPWLHYKQKLRHG